MGKSFFSSPKHPNPLWGPTSPLFIQCQQIFRGCESTGTGRWPPYLKPTLEMNGAMSPSLHTPSDNNWGYMYLRQLPYTKFVRKHYRLVYNNKKWKMLCEKRICLQKNIAVRVIDYRYQESSDVLPPHWSLVYCISQTLKMETHISSAPSYLCVGRVA
jgi:hypothetical protein